MLEEVFLPFAPALGFSAEDLRANRDGRLSGRQRRMLWGRFWWTLVQGVLLFVVPLVVVVGLLAWGEGVPFADVIFDLRAQTGYLLAAVLTIAYLLASVRHVFLFLDLLGERVRTVQGVVSLSGRYLKIQNYQFVVDEDLLGVIQSGVVYRAYVLPASATLLSLEFAE